MTWINFLVSSSNTGTHSTSGCPTIISRSEWGARAPTQHNSRLPATPGHVYIHHGATPGCHTKAECIQRVRSYQNYHMDSHGNVEVRHFPHANYVLLIVNASFLLSWSMRSIAMCKVGCTNSSCNIHQSSDTTGSTGKYKSTLLENSFGCNKFSKITEV